MQKRIEQKLANSPFLLEQTLPRRCHVWRVADGALGEVQCLEDATPRAGQVSLSVVEGAVWLVAGDSVLRAGSANASTGRFSVAGSWPRD